MRSGARCARVRLLRKSIRSDRSSIRLHSGVICDVQLKKRFEIRNSSFIVLESRIRLPPLPNRHLGDHVLEFAARLANNEWNVPRFCRPRKMWGQCVLQSLESG